MDHAQADTLLGIETAAGVRTITLLNGPAHPLSLRMIAALQRALDEAATEPDCRVLVLAAPGHIFCAGHDLKEMAHHRAGGDKGRAFLTQLFSDCAAMMVTLSRFPKPTIAMIDGIATAGGLQLAASCDLRFVSDRATFCLPGIVRGGFCTTPAVAVSRAISRTHLLELIYAGTPFDAAWALRTGLATRLFAPDDLPRETHAFAAMLATRNAGPILSGKRALDAHLDLSLEDAYALATPVMVEQFMV